MPVLILAACLALVLAAPPQSLSSSSTIETPHVSIALSSTAVGGQAGARLLVDITPKPKMHIYAPGEKEGIPVEIALHPGPAFKPGKPVFPPPQKYFFPPLKLTQLVYSSPFRITLPITIARKASAGSLTVTGTLHYQACDDAVCYVPKQVRLTWVVK